MELTNNNGFLTDAAGVIRGIEVPISDEQVTGLKRVARHEGFTVGADMQMIQQVRVITLGPDGQTMAECVAKVASGMALNQLQNRYADALYSANTAGAMVDQTGKPVTEGGIEQLQFFQGITLGILKAKGEVITDASSVPVLVYVLLKSEILKLDLAGRF